MQALKNGEGEGKGGGRVAYTFGDAVRVSRLSPPRPQALLARRRSPSARRRSSCRSARRCRPAATRGRASSEALRRH